MNLKAFAPSRWAAGLAISLVVVLVAGACGTRFAPEPQGQVSMAPTVPAAVDAAATISANLRTPLASTAPTAAPLSPRVVPGLAGKHTSRAAHKRRTAARAAHGYADPASNPLTYPNAYSAA